jgi:xanthine dehydrogenase accessory factor
MSDSAASFYEQLTALGREGTAFVLVILTESLGSAPSQSGAKMLVTAAGLHSGTVGGGKVEAKAIALAQEMLADASHTPQLLNWALKSDVGMTCGGSVKLYFEPHAGGGAGAKWPVWIFGAGHVVQALVPVLAPLDCQLTVVDPRRDWLDRLPRARNVRYLEAAEPAERKFPFVGVIGSDAKAKVLQQELIAAGLPPERAAEFRCPVGLPFGNNDPREIALSIAAQLLTERDRLRPR